MTELLSHPTTTHPTDREPEHIAAVAELRALLPGQVATPGSEDWDLLRRGWIVNVDQHPAAVVTVLDEEDVVAAVGCAARHGLSVSTQPVGHGATTALTGTVLLRTGALQDIHVDAVRRTARVGAGVKWGTLLAAVEPTGLIALAGSNPDPSVVGFTLGGGLSWFSRAHGLAAHSVLAFDLVGADGGLRHVTAASDPDLFWAMCGGGGDFGVVTAIEIRLFEAPGIHGGRMMWPVEMARPVLSAYREICATAPDELTLWAHVFRFPPAPMVPEPLRGKAFVSVDVAFLGSEVEANRLLSGLRQLPACVQDSVAAVPFSELGGIAAEPVDPMPTRETSAMLADLDEHDLDRLLDVVGAGRDVPLAVVQIRHLGGALSRAHDEQGPNGSIREQFQLFLLGVPMTPEMDAGIAAAFSMAFDAVAKEISGRTFFNFLGSDSDPGAAFGCAALDRLRAVKRAVDPTGVFRSNRPVLG